MSNTGSVPSAARPVSRQPSELLPGLRSLAERRLQRPQPTQTEQPLDATTLEQLRSLGYLE